MKSAIAMLVVVMGCGGVMGQTIGINGQKCTSWPEGFVFAGGVVWDGNGCPYPQLDGKCYDSPVKGCLEFDPKTALIPCSGGGDGHTNPPNCVPASQWIQQSQTPEKPLKCGKYFHVSHGCKNPMDACIDITGHCDPDLHTVTEKEWQELNERLRMAEAWRQAGLRAGKIAEQCLVDLGVCTDRMNTAHRMVQGLVDDMKAKKP